MELAGNRIGVAGAQHFADALRVNTVILILSSSLSYSSSSLHIDTHHSGPSAESNRSRWSRTSR